MTAYVKGMLEVSNEHQENRKDTCIREADGTRRWERCGSRKKGSFSHHRGKRVVLVQTGQTRYSANNRGVEHARKGTKRVGLDAVDPNDGVPEWYKKKTLKLEIVLQM